MVLLVGAGLLGKSFYRLLQIDHVRRCSKHAGDWDSHGTRSITSHVLKLVLSGAMSLVLIGTLIGLAGAYAITRVMSHLLFQVTPTDLATFAAVPLVLLSVALIACLIPARRATRVDPLVALRYESRAEEEIIFA